jgi:dUTP pyrophosphatase
MPLIRVKKLHPAAQVPRYAHTGPFGDLAADLYAVEPVTLAAAGETGSTALVLTGIAVAFPADYGALIEDRSGLALKGLTTLAGVIDPGYRGEIKVVATNLNPAKFTVNAGDRIAQLRIVQRIEATFEETGSLDETVRSERGFGSTGA